MFRLLLVAVILISGCENSSGGGSASGNPAKGSAAVKANTLKVIDGPYPTMAPPATGVGLNLGAHDVVLLASATSVKLTKTPMKISSTSITDGKASNVNFDAYAVSADAELAVSSYFGVVPFNKSVPTKLVVHEAEPRCPIIIDPKNGIEVSAAEATEDLFGWWLTKCTWTTTDYSVVGHGYRSSSDYSQNALGYFTVTLPISSATAPLAFLGIALIPSGAQVTAPQLAAKGIGGNGEAAFQATPPKAMPVAEFEAALGPKMSAPSSTTNVPPKK